ncbi:CvpA family protein [Anaerovorax odorimutans]|uniref:CvpA family protein n=1 Tax=Anaerovorax odorimutans TaxID=109327 RepID=UPI00040FABE4|nr:CvpA family protein [Anaerovorax odorimutans]
MYLDIIICVIIIFTMVQGYRHGFVYTFLRMAGWLISVILGFICYPKVTEFLKTKTKLYSVVHEKISDNFLENTSSAAPDSSSTAIHNLEDLPSAIHNIVNSITNSITSSISDGLATIIFNILCFIIIVIVIKAILFFITSLFSKKSNDGIMGGIDGILGLVMGGIKGLIIVFVFLALLVPITSLWGNTVLLDSLDTSIIADQLYDNNLIFVIMKDFL